MGEPTERARVGVTAFEQARPRLFGVAYRMLGSVPDAEDVVQETWLRWQAADRRAVREPVAFLTTTATRIAINAATSAHARRVHYVGPWLPEPVDTSEDPALGAVNGRLVELAVLALLQKLTPTQRAAYVLHEAFAYSFAEVGAVLGITEAAARQSTSRARLALRRDRSAPVSGAEQTRLLVAFVAAARNGDLAALETLLAEDAVAVSDGGGAVSAARMPVQGRHRVARFMAGAAAKFGPGTEVRLGQANGAPAIYLRDGDETVAVLVVEVIDRTVSGVYAVLNPAKLNQNPRHLRRTRHERDGRSVKEV